MAPKAANARKRFNRNRRFRGHGRLSGRWPAAAWPQGVPTRGGPLVYPPVIQPGAMGVASVGGAHGLVGGAHGPESGECEETFRPEPSLSRAWPPLGPVARGGLAAGRTNKGRTPCISPRDSARRHGCGFCRRGPWPRKRRMRGNVSTGTLAFAGMARSYNTCARGPAASSHGSTHDNLRIGIARGTCPRGLGTARRPCSRNRLCARGPAASSHGSTHDNLRIGIARGTYPRGSGTARRPCSRIRLCARGRAASSRRSTDAPRPSRVPQLTASASLPR